MSREVALSECDQTESKFPGSALRGRALVVVARRNASQEQLASIRVFPDEADDLD